MRPWIVTGVVTLSVACPQPDPTFSDSYDGVVSDLRTLEQNFAELQEQVGTLSTELDAADQRVEELEALLEQTTAERLTYLGELEAVIDVSSEGNTVVISGRDVRITSDGTVNRGNLLLGDVSTAGSAGSHNIVVGTGHSWATNGSVILGSGHDVTGDAAFVSGEDHTVSGAFAGVLAGSGHTVSGAHAVVLSGANNTARADSLGAVIVGGRDHIVEGSTVGTQAEYNVLVGGSGNLASDASSESVIVGGANNTTGGRQRCVGLATLPVEIGAPSGTRGACREDDQVTFETPVETP